MQNGTAQLSSVISSGNLVFNGSTSVAGSLQHTGNMTIAGIFNAAGSVSAMQIALVSGELAGSGTITSPNPLQVLGGTLAFSGSDLTPGGVNLLAQSTIDVLAMPSNGVVNILSGNANFHETSASGGTINVAGSNASLTFLGGFYSSAVNFTATGGYSSAALLSNVDAGNHFTTTLLGPLNLGPSGVMVGSLAGMIVFEGAISGGPMVLNASATISGGTNTFAGLTLGENDTLDLQGELQLTGPLEMGLNSTLFIDNLSASGTTNFRIDQSVPIVMDGGWLDLEAQKGQSVSESLGTVTLDSGFNRITAHASANNATVSITVANLVVNPGAVLDLQADRDWFNSYPQFGSGGTGPYLFINNQPDTNYLGGAFIYAIDPNPFTATDFLKYSSATGVTPLAQSDYFTGPESSWQNGLIPRTPPNSSLTLTGSRSVTALSIGMPTDASALTGDTLNLASFTLNVVQGGLLMPYYTVITGSAGSRLTAGGNSPIGTLYFYSVGYNNFNSPTIMLPVNITDNPGPDGQYDPVPGGPLDADNGVVSVIFTGYNYYLLTGTNTYTGTTYLAGPSTTVEYASAAAVSHGPISVTSGNLIIDSGVAAVTGPITVNGGSLTGPGSFQATSYNIQSGVISATILGNGPLTKSSTGSGTVSLTPSYTGPISVLGGTLNIGSGTLTNAFSIQNGVLAAPAAQLALLGPVTMGDNSTLEVYSVNNEFGASLNFSPSSLTVGNNAYVSFGGYWNVGGAGDPFTDSSDPSRHLNISLFAPTITGGGGYAILEISSGQKNVGNINGGQTVQVDPGASLTADSFALGTLYVDGTFSLRSNSAGPESLVYLGIAGTTNAWSGVLDLANHGMVVEPGPASGVRSSDLLNLQNEILEGRNGGTWTGTGITSSTAAANPTVYSVGIFDNAILGLTSFGGGTGNADSNSILISLAHNGDANDDGTVDSQDLAILGSHWLEPATNWAMGDLNDDGIVNMQDLQIVENNWDAPESFATAFSALQAQGEFPGVIITPEPASLSALAFGATAMLLARRVRRRLPPNK